MPEFDAVKYKNELNKQKYDRINLMTPKGKKDLIKAAADASGVSVNELINTAIDMYLQTIGGKDAR